MRTKVLNSAPPELTVTLYKRDDPEEGIPKPVRSSSTWSLSRDTLKYPGEWTKRGWVFQANCLISWFACLIFFKLCLKFPVYIDRTPPDTLSNIPSPHWPNLTQTYHGRHKAPSSLGYSPGFYLVIPGFYLVIPGFHKYFTREYTGVGWHCLKTWWHCLKSGGANLRATALKPSLCPH